MPKMNGLDLWESAHREAATALQTAHGRRTKPAVHRIQGVSN